VNIYGTSQTKFWDKYARSKDTSWGQPVCVLLLQSSVTRVSRPKRQHSHSFNMLMA